ncbi:MAG: hypothetical protein ACK4YO_02795, partial [Candidatus Altarchaeaceae archaeon]
NSNVTVILRISNAGKLGEGTAYNVSVKDILPENMSYISGTSKITLPNGTMIYQEPSINGNVLTWEQFVIPPAAAGNNLLIIEFKVTANQTGTYTNIANVTALDVTGSSCDRCNASDSKVMFFGISNLTVEFSNNVAVTPCAIGETNITITNKGNNITNVSIKINVPTGWNIVDLTGSGIIGKVSENVWNLKDISTNEIIILTLKLYPNTSQNALDYGTIEAILTAFDIIKNDTVEESNIAIVTYTKPSPTLNKILPDLNNDISTYVEPGDIINVCINITNSLANSAPFTITKIIDTLPSGFELINSTGCNFTNINGTLECYPNQIVDLGDSFEYCYNIKATSNVSTPIIYKPATVTFKDGCEKGQNSTADINNGAGPYSGTFYKPLLSATKSISPSKQTFNAGETINYTITIKNEANIKGTAYNITVSDTLPEYLLCNNTYTWKFERINPQGQESIILTCQVLAPSNGTANFTNIAYINYTDGYGTLQPSINASAEQIEILGLPDLTVNKTIEVKVEVYQPGQGIVFIINVTNIGNIPLQNINVTDILDNVTAYNVTLNDNPINNAINGNIVNLTIPNLDVGQSAIIKIYANISENATSGIHTNFVNVSVITPIGIIVKNSSVDYVIGVPSLTITKQAPDLAAFGEIINYTIIVTNNGTYNLTNLEV